MEGFSIEGKKGEIPELLEGKKRREAYRGAEGVGAREITEERASLGELGGEFLAYFDSNIFSSLSHVGLLFIAHQFGVEHYGLRAESC